MPHALGNGCSRGSGVPRSSSVHVVTLASDTYVQTWLSAFLLYYHISYTGGDDDCCIGTIEDNGIVCGENGAIAPCILPETTPAPVQSSDSTSASQTPTDSVAPQQSTSSPTVEPTSSSSTPSASPVGGQMPTLAPSTAPTNFPFGKCYSCCFCGYT